jgi:hypothetical protein
MRTALEKIQLKAKELKRSNPNAKWTDLIKKASTELKKVGSIGATSKKKKATKKAATKKVVSKRKPKVVKVLKQHGTSARAYDKRHQALPAGRRISKSGRAYTETRSNRSDKGVLLGVRKPMHKDTKSHNVRISVMSGININHYFTELDKLIKKLNDYKDYYQEIKSKKYDNKAAKTRDLRIVSNRIIDLKDHIRDIKSIIVKNTRKK